MNVNFANTAHALFLSSWNVQINCATKCLPLAIFTKERNESLELNPQAYSIYTVNKIIKPILISIIKKIIYTINVIKFVVKFSFKLLVKICKKGTKFIGRKFKVLAQGMAKISSKIYRTMLKPTILITKIAVKAFIEVGKILCKAIIGMVHNPKATLVIVAVFTICHKLL